MGVSLFVPGATPSSLVADTKLGALQLLTMELNNAEAKRNRVNKNNQTNFVSYSLAADAQTTLAATITIPATMQEDTVTGAIDFVVEEPFNSDYITFVAGDGDLNGATGPCDALVKLARKCTYLEKQIDPNVVVTQADQVVVTPDLENGQYVVTLNLPEQVKIDAATGAVTSSYTSHP
jgi:hypothetical protein